jgi:hypothetical protein
MLNNIAIMLIIAKKVSELPGYGVKIQLLHSFLINI